MVRLRAAFESLGFKNVSTFIQSGNVVFSGPKASDETLHRRIEPKLSSQFGFPIPVVIRSAEELNRIVGENPFLKADGIDVSKLHVLFLLSPPSAESLKKLTSLASAFEQCQCVGRDLYLYLPNGVARTKLTGQSLDKSLSLSATCRNWNTVKKLCELSSAQS
jgi:uncharacterized protein (DUF1697 family)